MINNFSPVMDIESLKDTFPSKEKIHLYETVSSTNILAREALEKAIKETPLHHHDGSLTQQGQNLHGSIFIAEQQTGGKGRQGRSFFSPQATGLYMSLIIVPPHGVTNPAGLTATMAVATCQALEKIYNITPAIKWVNDIFYNRKKVGGILAEGVMDSNKRYIPGAVIGIGLNILPPPQGFPPEIESIAGAIFPTYSEEKNPLKKELVVAIVTNFLHLLESLWNQDSQNHASDDVMEEYRNRCLIKPGTKIKIFPVAGSQENAYTATCLGIDQQARLQVITESGQQKFLDSGEVSLQSLNFTNFTNSL